MEHPLPAAWGVSTLSFYGTSYKGTPFPPKNALITEVLSIGASSLSAECIVSKKEECSCDFHLHQSLFTPLQVNHVCGGLVRSWLTQVYE